MLNEWIAANIVQIIIAASGFGALLYGQREASKRLEKLEEAMTDWSSRMTELDHKFWSEKWPVVGQNTERIRALEEAVQGIRADVHGIRAKVESLHNNGRISG